jgi:hypothetical protein
MGIIKGGILGGFSNKTGAVIGAYWRTLNVMRGLPRKSGKAATQQQLDQQSKFRLIVSLLSKAKSVINRGYNSDGKIATSMNMAVSDNLAQAIMGASPLFAVDYPLVTFSKGSLDEATDVTLEGIATSKVDFKWTYDGESSDTINATDEATLLVYNPIKGRFVKLEAAALRSELGFALQMPASYMGDTVHAYLIFFSQTNKKKVSNTTYAGQVVVMA